MFWSSGTSSTNVVTFWLKLAFMRFCLFSCLTLPPTPYIYLGIRYFFVSVYRITSFTFGHSTMTSIRVYSASVIPDDHFVLCSAKAGIPRCSNAFLLPRDTNPCFHLNLSGSDGGKYDHQTIGIKLAAWIKQIFVASKLDLPSAVEKREKAFGLENRRVII